jgi:hypothetical protein
VSDGKSLGAGNLASTARQKRHALIHDARVNQYAHVLTRGDSLTKNQSVAHLEAGVVRVWRDLFEYKPA